MTGQDRPLLAWVESPFQLLGAVEAFAAGHLTGHRLTVLPRADLEPLRRTVAELRRLGLPSGVELADPGPAPLRLRGQVAVGDAFSGQVHRMLVLSELGRVTLLDDGRSTRRVMDALLEPGVPLVRPHVRPTFARARLAYAARTRLRRLARHGRLDVVTAMDLPAAVIATARRRGIAVQRHHFAWLRSRPADPIADHGTVVLGTSLVANRLIAREPYLDWVRGVAAEGPVTYRAHRREDDSTLAPIARIEGVHVLTGEVPVEISLRGLGARHRVLTLPTTAVSSLRLINPSATIHEFEVPDPWWLPEVSPIARGHLVPDVGGARAEPAGQ